MNRDMHRSIEFNETLARIARMNKCIITYKSTGEVSCIRLHECLFYLREQLVYVCSKAIIRLDRRTCTREYALSERVYVF